MRNFWCDYSQRKNTTHPIWIYPNSINVNVNVWHTYWASLNPVTEVLHAVELTFISVANARWRCAKNSFLGCNHQSTCMPSYSLYVQLLWYPMYCPKGIKAWVSPVEGSKPYSISAPTQDSNPGGRIQNHKRWPIHYLCILSVLPILWFAAQHFHWGRASSAHRPQLV